LLTEPEIINAENLLHSRLKLVGPVELQRVVNAILFCLSFPLPVHRFVHSVWRGLRLPKLLLYFRFLLKKVAVQIAELSDILNDIGYLSFNLVQFTIQILLAEV